MPTTHPFTLEGCHHIFHEVPTCSTCNQEDEGQLSGRSVNKQIRKTAEKGLKLPVSNI